jgi:SAM-dependent methyltransferase
MDWVKRQVETYDLANTSVLDVGSLDVNGNPRHLFTGAYLGVDMRPGSAVDKVLNAHDLASGLGAHQFDTVLCLEMLEHDTAPWISMDEMRFVIKHGGYLIATTRGYDEDGYFPVHGYPDDHWRFSVSGFTELLCHSHWDPIEVIPDPEQTGVLSIARAA